MKKLKVGILGTRGIPNNYGGFEQFAEYFAVFLANQGYDVSVYNSSQHIYKQKQYRGVKLISCYDPEDSVGTLGQFIYDFNCIVDSTKRSFDIILQLGYTSSSIWNKLLPSRPIIITNMDGLEWKRSKYSKLTRLFLKRAERLAVKSSDYLIADSIGIQEYLKRTYGRYSEYIAYGAELFEDPKEEFLKEYNLQPFEYNLLIARMEPENNIETILDGIVFSEKTMPFIVIGRYDMNSFGKYIKKKYSCQDNIFFLGGLYDIDKLNNLRFYSNLYFHGHSVGGTNPSLLEAMASKSLIIAHDNIFNKSVLLNNAFYFQSSNDIKEFTEKLNKNDHIRKVENAFLEIIEFAPVYLFTAKYF